MQGNGKNISGEAARIALVILRNYSRRPYRSGQSIRSPDPVRPIDACVPLPPHFRQKPHGHLHQTAWRTSSRRRHPAVSAFRKRLQSAPAEDTDMFHPGSCIMAKLVTCPPAAHQQPVSPAVLDSRPQAGRRTGLMPHAHFINSAIQIPSYDGIGSSLHFPASAAAVLTASPST